MEKVKVRCWIMYDKIGDHNIQLYVSYPENNYGHDLITCLSCGQVYAITILDEVYKGPDRKEKLEMMKCIKCNKKLSDTYSNYPEQYLYNGNIHVFNKPIEIPNDADSVVIEFPSIY